MVIGPFLHPESLLLQASMHPSLLWPWCTAGLPDRGTAEWRSQWEHSCWTLPLLPLLTLITLTTPLTLYASSPGPGAPQVCRVRGQRNGPVGGSGV